MKKLFLLLTLFFSVLSFAQGPEFELYTGIVNPKVDNTRLGYMIGVNLTPHLYQYDKNNPKEQRKYLNKYLIGVEFSGYQSSPNTNVITSNSQPPTQSTDCNCTSTPIGGVSTDGTYISKQDVRAVSLNFGVEVYKGWFLTSGVSSYKHEDIFNNETINTYRSTYIDFGVRKFIKWNRVYLSPFFKFNPEVTSFGIGFSYY